MTLRRFVPVLSVCALVFTAVHPHAQTPAQAPAITMEGYPAPGQPAKVTLLTAGTGPKKALRYDIPATFKGRLEMVTTMNMAMTMMGQAMEMPVPPIKMGVDLAVTNVAANGDVTYSMAFTSMTIDGDASSPLAMQLQASTAGITGVKGSTTMTNRGLAKSTSLEVADPTLKATLSDMTGSIENLSTAFPEEAVGVGARWESRMAISAGGQTQFQKTIYEVTAIDGASVSLKTTSETTAPPQAINNPMATATGAELTLDKMTGAGTGTIVIKLDSLTPTSSVEQTSSMAATMNLQGQSMQVTTDGKIKITVTPVKLP